jgi:hypothetical protein
MAAVFEINVVLQSGDSALFVGIEYGKARTETVGGVMLKFGAAHPAPVTVIPPAGQVVKSMEYNLRSDIRNYHNVIIPDSGRWFINNMQLVSFWRYNGESAVNDVKMPLYIFTGQDMNTSMAFGVVGETYETTFRTLEPKVNRALIVYMRKLSMQIKRGTDSYPIPARIARHNADGSITEHLYFRTAADAPDQPWLLTLRDFAAWQKKIYNVPDVTAEGALHPLWCSWTDWFSDDVTEEVVLRSVGEGVKLGIRNYIIDDGWFGPGLDNDYDVELNIGDWEADPAKIKDMAELVRRVKAAGGVPMIWCAPHAVAPGAKCFPQRKNLLIMDEKGQLVMTPNKFHSLCFMCREARELMADICASFVTRWDFEGAKYDLFNCVPNVPCRNPQHVHDATSMIEGLEATLELMDRKCRALKKDYIVELKQNYATPFLSRYGSMTRAGDTPYNSEGNFLRTLYVQAYSPYSINDYQTITNEDTPVAAACVVIKMIAAGIPTYSIDFDRLNDDNKKVIAHYNHWYVGHIVAFGGYRIPLDGGNNVLKLPANGRDFLFLVNGGGPVPLERSATILNGTFRNCVCVCAAKRMPVRVTPFDCMGRELPGSQATLEGQMSLEVPPGGRIEIDA